MVKLFEYNAVVKSLGFITRTDPVPTVVIDIPGPVGPVLEIPVGPV